MNVVALQDSANIRLVGVALSKTIDGRLLRAERGDELKREFGRVERLQNEVRYGFFDFYSVHTGSIGESSVLRMVIDGTLSSYLPFVTERQGVRPDFCTPRAGPLIETRSDPAIATIYG